MWHVAARSLSRASSRAWQKQLPRPSPAPAAPQRRGPAWTPGMVSARSLSAMAPAIRLSPAARSLFDEPLAIAVQGLGPRQQVTLRASLRDEAGELFQARARYQAGDDGELDLARCPALPGGSFSGLEPMGLLWALQPQKPFRRLMKKDVQSPFVVQLEVFEGHGEPPGRLLAQAQHERAFLRDGVRRVPVREGRVRATLFVPPGNGPFPGIIDLYGIGGGLLEYRACLLANYGFSVLALAFYDYEDLPKEAKEFHLEYFEEAINYMLQHSQVKGPGIGLLGFSKGGDLCVSMASFLKGITATALINGSVANVGTVLRYKDITIPPLGVNAKRIKVNESGIADIIDVLNNPLEGPDCQSFIPLEKAECRFLFIVGQDDHNWKSEFFAVEGSKRLQAHGKEKPEIVCYPGAGHYIEPPFFPMCAASMHLLVGRPVLWGGEPKAHCDAQIDAWQQIQAFFRKHLAGKPSGTSSKL
ncbi:LOW QUALITY PROTEIN: acyl-coenzyme A thioesterase 1-like [Falco rusticolus]|uniref:LOW QUALITY PROTEIN: acyl-coenzyme A thioesterase 1-like n=1 Tax=Falco rusticolus TaxID=120794 RepID=UPI001886A915|nr:LOW QUALITY PROTEIN: acyl-coenzyme A thioesterase 1-like [Falco rusticolus]